MSASLAQTWTKHTSPDGRPFWSKNGQSVWEKPSELKTPAEKEMENTPWKEYETGGRKYWVHDKTKETTWNPPKEIADIIARYSQPPTGPPGSPSLPRAPSFVASSSTPHQQPSAGSPLAGSASPMTAQTGALVAPGGSFGSLPPRPAGLPPIPVASALSAAAAPVIFDTAEEAEAAFKGMLKSLKVDSSWTWEMVMKEAITDPLYKALKTLAERKNAFESYLRESREEERVEREKSLNKCRKDWTKAMEKLGGGIHYEEGVKTWWSWERGRRVMSEKCPEVWKGPRNDEERKILFDEFVSNLKQKEETRKRELRGKNMDKLTKILESLELDLAGPIRWQEVRATLYRTPEWHRDPELQRMEPIDMLTVVEDEVRRAEKELAEQRQRVAEDKRRKARKAREEYVALLSELVAEDKIVAGTTWKSIYPLIDADPRYLNLLGTPGSSPLDLFWDVVDELDVRAEQDEQVVEFVAREKGIKVDENSNEEEFVKALERDERIEKIGVKALQSSFDKLQRRAVRAAKEERRRAEKKLRVMVDDLRYAYKKLDPPVDLEASYEDVLPRIRDAPEFIALEDNDEARKTAFDKFVKRQKEKRADREAADAERAERDRIRAERRAKEREHDMEYEMERERDRERRLGSRRESAGELPYGGSGEDRKRRPSFNDDNGEGEGDGDADKRERKVARLDGDQKSKFPSPSQRHSESFSINRLSFLDLSPRRLLFTTSHHSHALVNSFAILRASTMSAPQSIPQLHDSSSARDDSASPTLSSSPLQSMSGMGSALPTNGHAREDSYGSTGSDAEADLPVDNEEAFEGHDDENEALKKYKEQMHSYIASRFASFKTDLEQKTRAEGTSMPPTGLPKRLN